MLTTALGVVRLKVRKGGEPPLGQFGAGIGLVLIVMGFWFLFRQHGQRIRFWGGLGLLILGMALAGH